MTTATNVNHYLAALKSTDTISYYRVRSDDSIVITLPVTYADPTDPNAGYDDASEALAADLMEGMADCGFTFADAGVEEDGSGEWFTFARRA